MTTTINEPESLEEVEAAATRGLLRSAFASLFWVAISHRRKNEGLTLTAIAEKIGTNKSAISRWFSEARPNWRVNTMADLSRSIDMEMIVFGRDKKTSTLFAPHGVCSPADAMQMLMPRQSSAAVVATTTERSKPRRIAGNNVNTSSANIGVLLEQDAA